MCPKEYLLFCQKLITRSKIEVMVHPHQLRTPKRETGIEQYIRSYFAWQIEPIYALVS